MASVTTQEDYDGKVEMNDTAMQESQSYYAKILEEYNAGNITDEDITKLGEEKDIDTSSILEYVHMTELERQQHPLYKTDLSDVETIHGDSDVARFDNLADGEVCTDIDGVTLTGVTVHSNGFLGIGASDTNLVRCESDYLGTFLYDPEQYRVGYKELQEADGSTSQLPVLEYIGPGDPAGEGHWDWMDWADMANGEHLITTPYGCKVLDYTFEGRDDLMFVPVVSSTTESLHCAFKDCTTMKAFDDNTLFHGVQMNAYVPSTVKDLSMAFAGCTELNANVYSIDCKNEALAWPGSWSDISGSYGENIKDQLPHDLMNGMGAFSGCENMGSEYESGFWFWDKSYSTPHAANYGIDAETGENLTPYLAPSYIKDIYEGISDKSAIINNNNYDGVDWDDEKQEHYKAAMKGFESYFNDDGSIKDEYKEIVEAGLADGSIDSERFSEAQAAQALLYYGEGMEGHVMTSVEVASGDAYTNNKIIDENGEYWYDSTGEKVSYQEETKNLGSWWEGLIVDGVVGLGGYTASNLIVSKLTGSEGAGKVAGLLVGVGGTLALEFGTDLLPDSLYPAMSWIADKVPEGALKDKLTEWADSLPSAAGYKLNEKIKEYNESLGEYNAQWDNEVTLAQEHYQARLNGFFKQGVDLVDNLPEENMRLYMQNNGGGCAQECSFYAVAYNGEESAQSVYDTVSLGVSSGAGAYEQAIADNGGTCTDEMKADMADYYTTLMTALESYDAGAKDGMLKYNGRGSDMYNMQMSGLNMVNRAYTQAVMESLMEMNAQYDFMTEEDWQKIEALDIDGVDIENIRGYNESYFDSLKAVDAADVEHQLEVIEARGKEESQVEDITEETEATGVPESVEEEAETQDIVEESNIGQNESGAHKQLPLDGKFDTEDDHEMSADEYEA